MRVAVPLDISALTVIAIAPRASRHSLCSCLPLSLTGSAAAETCPSGGINGPRPHQAGKMISLRVRETEQFLSALSLEDARVLRRSLESTSTGSEYFIDSATLDLLKGHGLTDAVVTTLRTAIGTRDGLTVTLDDGDPDEPEERDRERGEAAFIAEQRLICVVCRHGLFRHRRAQLHSAAASFFNMEWLGPVADCYVCSKCGYVHWFISPA